MRKGNESWKMGAGRVRCQANGVFGPGSALSSSTCAEPRPPLPQALSSNRKRSNWPEKRRFGISGFVRRFFVHQIFLIFAFCVTAEASKNPATTSIASVPAFIHVPPKLNRFSSWQKLNPIWWLGNADDPEPPKTYRPGKRTRVLTCHFRNPFHNFTFYVIGIGDKVHLPVGRYADSV